MRYCISTIIWLIKGLSMLSPVWQRIGILTGVLLGSLCWFGILPSLQSPSGSSGLVLLNVSSTSTAIILVIVAGLPSLILGALLSTIGRFTAGVCVFAGTLMVLTCFSGSASGWITRASLPGDYWTLIFETLIYSFDSQLWFIRYCCNVNVQIYYHPRIESYLKFIINFLCQNTILMMGIINSVFHFRQWNQVNYAKQIIHQKL